MTNRLDFLRDSASSFPNLDDPDAVLSMRIWHCRYRSLKVLSRFRHLRELVVASFPDSSLEAIGELRELRYLRVLHMPKVSSLAPLAALTQLEVLRLATSPAWDASGRVQVVESLRPIESMAKLRHIELFGVCTKTRSLAEIESCASLRTAHFSKYPAAEVERMIGVLGVSDEFAPSSSFDD